MGAVRDAGPSGVRRGLNLYEYARDDPINGADPSGLGDDDSPDANIMEYERQVEFTWRHGIAGAFNQQVMHIMNRIHECLGMKPFASGDVPLGKAALDIYAATNAAAPEAAAESASEEGLAAASERGTGMYEETAGTEGLEETAEDGCFVAGTPVQMADGSTKPIEQVQVGDWVQSRDPKTRRTEGRQVTRVFKHPAPETETAQFLDLANGQTQTVTATPEHPFFTPDGQVMPLSTLGIGGQVVTRAGPSPYIAKISKEEHPGGVAVYNLEIAGDHTYFVGTADGGVWVHNICSTDVGEARFAVTSDGAVIRTSRAELEQGFQDAGFHSYPNTRTAEPGMNYVDPSNGNRYRVMQGTGENGLRLMNHAPGDNPLLPSGANLPSGNPGAAVIRRLTHFPLRQ